MINSAWSCVYCNNRNRWSPLSPIYWFFLCACMQGQSCNVVHCNICISMAMSHLLIDMAFQRQSSFITFNLMICMNYQALFCCCWHFCEFKLCPSKSAFFFLIWILDSQMPPKWLDSTKTSHSCDDQNVTKIKHFEIACSPLLLRQDYTN